MDGWMAAMARGRKEGRRKKDDVERKKGKGKTLKVVAKGHQEGEASVDTWRMGKDSNKG
jgi:hypothetical protein